jgi:hypothetical protein
MFGFAHIDVVIPFYMHQNDLDSYKITFIVFSYLKEVKKMLLSEQKAKLTFTFVGSEKNRSQHLVEKIFNLSSEDAVYYEFKQKCTDPTDATFFEEYQNKIRFGLQKSREKEPDILLWIGSNDLVPRRVFDAIIKNYYDFNGNSTTQYYGIGNYVRGENAVFFCQYEGETNTMDIHENAFWWSGRAPAPRDKYLLSGGVLGVNKAAYMTYPDLLTKWSYDEGETEMMIRSKGTFQLYKSFRNYYINFKLKSGKDIVSFEAVKYYLNERIMQFTGLHTDFTSHVMKEMEEIIAYSHSCFDGVENINEEIVNCTSTFSAPVPVVAPASVPVVVAPHSNYNNNFNVVIEDINLDDL